MTPRPLARMRRATAILLMIAGLSALAGCDPRQFAYYLQPWEPTIAPPCTALNGKQARRVVLLTHAISSARSDSQNIDREVGQKVAAILKEKVKKLDLVDSSKVRAWSDANPTWSDPAEAARAFEADLAIYLEIKDFQIQNPDSPGLFQGKAVVDVKVSELAPPKDPKGKPISGVPKVSNQIYEDTVTTDFPSRAPQPIETGVSRSTFKKKFLQLVAAEISWRFVDHAPGDDIQDVSFSK